MEPVNLHKEVEIGGRAAELLENQVYKETMATLRQGLFDLFEHTPLRDHEGQHEIRLMLKLLGDFEKHIISIANTGKLAMRQINDERGIIKGFRP